MALDKGMTLVQQMLAQKYLKTTSQGYIFTEEGIEWLATCFQEIYHEVEKIHKELDNVWSKTSRITPSISDNDSIDSSDTGDSIQPE